MGPYLTALGLAWFATAIAFALWPSTLPLQDRLRAAAMWMGAAAMLFILQDPMSVMLLTAVLMLALAPSGADRKAAFFLVAVPALPTYLTAPVPFPGINFLFNLTPYKAAALVLLLPLLLQRRDQPQRPVGFSVADACLALYVLHTALTVGDALGSTSGLRSFIEQSIVLALPYIGLRLALRSPSEVETGLKAFLLVSVLLAAVTLLSTLKVWDFYRLYEPASVLSIPDFRSGFLRINATANTHSLGFHLAAAVIVLEALKRRLGLNFLQAMTLRAILLGALVFTDSRGAMVALVVGIGVYLLLLIRNRARRAALIACAVAAAGAGAIYLVTADLAAKDPYGTFAYRQELLRTAYAYLLERPWFGDYNFYRSGYFDHLRQGQHIIDVTNLHLQIALHYGLVGLGLFLTVVLQPIRSLARIARRAGDGSETPDLARMAAATAGILVGWLFLIATTSDVGLTMHIGIVFAALCRAICDAARTVSSAELPPVRGFENLPAARDDTPAHITGGRPQPA